MKVFLSLTVLLGVACALETSDERLVKKAPRPETLAESSSFQVARSPEGAPAEYQTGTSKVSRSQSKSLLQRLPAQLVDFVPRRRRDTSQTTRRLGLRAANDFYECQNAKPAPRDSDCKTIVQQVSKSNETLVVEKGACLTFQFNTCSGFFCALCQQTVITTDFVAQQLDNAEYLCVSNGQEGTVVGEDAPQWEAGFLRTGNSLPNYGDVCDSK